VSDKHAPPDLNDAQKRSLIGIVSGDGYQTILDIMEWFCDQQENKLLGISPALKDEVFAEHAIAHAQRIYFQDVVGYIDRVIEHETGLRKDNSRFKVEAEEANLMSALPITEIGADCA
jgi:hypothetical protein